MKGSILGYGAILAVLITGSFVILFITKTGPESASVASKEGELISFGNYGHFFVKMLNQSIEFISQRVAYDLGKNGGFSDNDVLWNLYYPRIDVLKKNLEDEIKDTLPSSIIKNNKKVTWGESDISVTPRTPLKASTYFFVEGIKSFSIYDELINSRMSLDHEINSHIESSYFKLLHIGREILENETYNSSLDDIGNLNNILEQDFPDLDFKITASEGIVEITIDEKCYPPDTYCLAPLNLEESGIIDPISGEQIPYDYIKLKFKTEAEQTGITPPIFDFDIVLIPDFDFVEAGDTKNVIIGVKSSGSDSKPVMLSSTVISESTGEIEDTIIVSFSPNNQEPTYFSVMKIETSSFTFAGTYDIIVRGTGNGITKEKTFILTVNPSMQFSIEVNPDSDIVVQDETKTAKVNVSIISGTPKKVDLSYEINPSEPTIGVSFSPDFIEPDFISTMTIKTESGTPDGTYIIEVIGIGGGTKKSDTYVLTVVRPFDFTIEVTPSSDEIYPTQNSIASVKVHKTEGIDETVEISSTVVSKTKGNIEPTITVTFSPSSDEPDPDFFSTMRITTIATTPVDEYVIVINGTTIDKRLYHEVTFELKIKQPECFIAGDCGSLPVCRYYKCENFECVVYNYPNNYVPDGNACGTVSLSCGDNCVDGYEYKNPTNPSETCSITCNGLGSCNPSCDPEGCEYNTMRKCRYDCNGDICWGGLECNQLTAKCRNCDVNPCDQTCMNDICWSVDGGPKPIPSNNILCQVKCSCPPFSSDGYSKVITDCSACTGSCSGFLGGSRECNCGGSNDCDGGDKSGCWKVSCNPSDTCTYECYDTDGGVNLNIRGTCIDAYGNPHPDTCTSSTIINEEFCSSDTTCIPFVTSCPAGTNCVVTDGIAACV